MIDLSERLKVVRETIQYHETLNPAAWDGLVIKPDIREALLKVAKHFVDKLFEKNPGLAKGGVLITDIILTGSNANFNWTAYSDFDVHVVVDYLNGLPGRSEPARDSGPIPGTDDNRTVIRHLFDLQRRLWSLTHKVTVAGYPVELYFQDSTETHISSGVYSLKNDCWILIPIKKPPTIHAAEIEHKWRAMRELIGEATSEDDLRVAYDKITQMRKTGLQTEGEFSTENLVFKALRNSGHIATLINKLQRVEDESILPG